MSAGGHPRRREAGPAVVFVGAGPGDPELVTRRGRAVLARADVVVADRPSLDPVIDCFGPATAERVHVGRTRSGPAWTLEAVVDLIQGHVDAGRRVVRLKSGDLFVCSRAAEEVEALTDRGVAVDLVPGVSAALAAPLAAGVALLPAGRGVCTVVAGNDDPLYPPVDWPALAGHGGAVVVLMGRAHQRQIGEHLLAGGRAATTPVHVVHGASRPDQQILTVPLSELGGARLPAPATLVVEPELHRSADAHP